MFLSLRRVAARISLQFIFSTHSSSITIMFLVFVCSLMLISIPTLFVLDLPCLAISFCSSNEPDSGAAPNVRVHRSAIRPRALPPVDPGDRSGVHGQKVNVSICKPSCFVDVTYHHPRSDGRRRIKHGEAVPCLDGYRPIPLTVDCSAKHPQVVCRLKPGYCVVRRHLSCGMISIALRHGSPFPRCMGRFVGPETVNCDGGKIIDTNCFEEDAGDCCELSTVLRSNSPDDVRVGPISVGRSGACPTDYDRVSLEYEGDSRCDGISPKQRDDVKCHCGGLNLTLVCQLKDEFC